jgi:hypothetical protein
MARYAISDFNLVEPELALVIRQIYQESGIKPIEESQ